MEGDDSIEKKEVEMLEVKRTKDVSLEQVKRMSKNLAEKHLYGDVNIQIFTCGKDTRTRFFVSCGHHDDKGYTFLSWQGLQDYYFLTMEKES